MNLNYLVSEHKKNRDIIFDLDNTLIDEKIYLYSAYEEIAIKADLYRYKEIKNFLINSFENKGRKNLYQELILSFGIKNFELRDFLYILRNHKIKGKINTKLWFRKFISIIGSNFPIYIITNGNITQQKNKIKYIKFPIGSNLKKVIFANEYQKKPSPDAYYALNKDNNIQNPIYIGDSKTDKDFATNLNIEFIDVIEFL